MAILLPRRGALVDRHLPDLHAHLLLFGKSYKGELQDFSLRHFTGKSEDAELQKESSVI